MTELYINRRLKIGESYFSEAEALDQGAILVVLAEPGAGKSRLLSQFGRLLGVSPIRASRFRHQTMLPPSGPLIIDALDEAAKVDQSSVDQVIVKAQESSNGRVIFASRSSEWQEARTNWIRDCFGIKPKLVRIEPLTTSDQKYLFDAHLPNEIFEDFLSEAERFELVYLLGNPQFFLLFSDAYMQSGRKFSSKANIFRDAVDRLARETGDAIATKPRPPTSELVEVASEVMSTLLLAGASGVSAKEQAADIDYPYLSKMAPGNTKDAYLALDTRLFKPGVEPEQHEPVHRIVAEFCAAQFIAQRISSSSNPLSLRRILALIAPNGAVRDELRGLLGWMASVGPERIQRAAIELDAYAVIANGDPSQLTTASKKQLLLKLAAIAECNPGFRRGDHWRRFSVGGFFTEALTSSVSLMLRSPTSTSSLVDLLLELIVNSGGPTSLADDIRTIMLNPAAPQRTRVWAAQAIQKLIGAISSNDFNALVSESSPDSLRVATQLISESIPDELSTESMESLLRAFIGTYQTKGYSKDDNIYMNKYYIGVAIKNLTVDKIASLLDRLTSRLTCTCGHPEYECSCRRGVSKVVGLLLDVHFATALGLHDADRIWGWIKSLWFEHPRDAEQSASIRVLVNDSDLRHQLHRRAFAGVVTHDEAWEVRWQLASGHKHSGLGFYDNDSARLTDYAFETNNPGMWSAFLVFSANRAKNPGLNAFRRRLREQAFAKAPFGAAWALQERRFKVARHEDQHGWRRRQQRRTRRETQRTERDRAHFEANRDRIENGEHLGYVELFSRLYFGDPDKLARHINDTALVENALRNALPMITRQAPTIEQLAMGHHWHIARVAFASCWIQYKDRGNLEHVDRAVLLAARVETSRYNSMSEEDYDAFRCEVDRLAFPTSQSVEQFARNFIEPGLVGDRNSHTQVGWLARAEFLVKVRSILAIEWLERYPAMPVSARSELFDIVARHGDRTALTGIIIKGLRCASLETIDEGEEARQHRLDDLRFWRIRQFFFDNAGSAGWEDLKDDPNTIFMIADKAGRYGDMVEGWPTLSAEKIFRILDAFVEAWPAVHLPSSYGTGDPPGQVAYRFLTDIVWRVANDTPERSLNVLDRLIADPRFVGFTATIQTLRAEATKKLALSGFAAPAPETVAKLFSSSGITSVEDLRAFTVEELGWLQEWLNTADTDPLDAFWPDGHVDENTARNRVVDSLQNRMTAMNMSVVIEHHMASSNRCDFTVSGMIEGRRRLLVVEAKGQWHPKLFTAAATQLNDQYASHQDAERQGIYLVFWFGGTTKVAGRTGHGIQTAEELRMRIVDQMPAELRGLIDVVVLDLSGNGALPKRQFEPKDDLRPLSYD